MTRQAGSVGPTEGRRPRTALPLRAAYSPAAEAGSSAIVAWFR